MCVSFALAGTSARHTATLQELLEASRVCLSGATLAFLVTFLHPPQMSENFTRMQKTMHDRFNTVFTV